MEAWLLGAMLLAALAVDRLISFVARRAQERREAARGGPEAPRVRPTARPVRPGPYRIEPPWRAPSEARPLASPPAPRRPRGPAAPPRPPAPLPSLRTRAGARAAVVAMAVLDRPAGAPPRWPSPRR